MIDYTKKLNCKKFERYRDIDINECTESNRGRIVNSPAIRRLE
jgi:dGTP triphosphohydrolase